MPPTLFEPVDGSDVRMIQRGERLRFARESRQALPVMRERLGQDLDRHVAIQRGIAHAIDLAHAPFADLGCHYVDAEPGAWGEGQRWRDYKGERDCGPDRSWKTVLCLVTQPPADTPSAAERPFLPYFCEARAWSLMASLIASESFKRG